MYAIIESCGKQYKVAEGDVVFFEKLDTEEGKKVTFDNVDSRRLISFALLSMAWISPAIRLQNIFADMGRRLRAW